MRLVTPLTAAVAVFMMPAAHGAHVCHTAGNVRFDVTAGASSTTLRRYDATTNALLSTTHYGAVPAPNPSGSFWGHGCAYAADMQNLNVWVYSSQSQTSAAYWDVLSATEDRWRFQTSINSAPVEIEFTSAACGGGAPPSTPAATPTPATPQPATPQPATPQPSTPQPATPQPSTPQSTPQPPAPPAGYTLFHSTGFSTNQAGAPWPFWSEYGNQNRHTANENEVQIYGPDNVNVQDGTLRLTALRDPSTGRITSGSVAFGIYFTYGRFEARLKAPAGRGLRPTFWILGSDRYGNRYPLHGQVNIFEFRGSEPGTLITEFHSAKDNVYTAQQGTPPIGRQYINRTAVPDITTNFHTYALEWTPELLTVTMDGQVVATHQREGRCLVKDWPFRKNFDIFISLPVGDFDGEGIDVNAFPATFEIDDVRIYTLDAPVEPQCDVRDYRMTLTTGVACNNLNGDLSFRLFAHPANSRNAQKVFVDSLGAMFGVPASPTFDVTSMRPICAADGFTRVLIAFTSVNRDLQPNFSGMPAAMQPFVNLMEEYVATGAWAVETTVSGATTCPHGNACVAPLAFESHSLPAYVSFVRYDYGGEDIGYHDDTLLNENVQWSHRSGLDRVDIRPNLQINYIRTGEWLRFSDFRMPLPCSDQSFRVKASNGAAEVGKLTATFTPTNGTNCQTRIANFDIQPTGSWDVLSETPLNFGLTCGCTYYVKWEFPVPNYQLLSFSLTPL